MLNNSEWRTLFSLLLESRVCKTTESAHKAMIVYIFLDSISEYVDWAGIRAAFVTADEIADSTKLSKGSVQAAMRRLKSMNWAKHTHGCSTINTYIIAELDVAVKRGLDMIGKEESSVK